MFEDLSNLCLVGMFIIAAVILLPRLMNMLGGNDYSQRGSESPRYDDRDIESSGGFGGSDRPRHDDPDIRSRGGFGSSGGSSGSGRGRFSLPSWGRRSSGSSGSGQADSPNVRSRGGFGRSKN